MKICYYFPINITFQLDTCNSFLRFCSFIAVEITRTIGCLMSAITSTKSSVNLSSFFSTSEYRATNTFTNARGIVSQTSRLRISAWKFFLDRIKLFTILKETDVVLIRNNQQQRFQRFCGTQMHQTFWKFPQKISVVEPLQ